MGKKKKERYIPKAFESDGNKSDVSANLYMSMLTSVAWKELSKGAKVLYLYCKAQYYAEKTKPLPKCETLSEKEKALCFTMNVSKWKTLYGIYKDNGVQFKKDMDQLLKYGFVDLVECGKTTRTKSIYKFSDRWHSKPP